MDMGVGFAGAGFIMSVATSVFISGRASGKQSEGLLNLGRIVTKIDLKVDAHTDDTEKHTTKELKVLQADVLDQRFKFQDQLIEQKFKEILMRIDQVGSEVRAVDRKVERALAACSSLSEELQKETGALAVKIESVRARLPRSES